MDIVFETELDLPLSYRGKVRDTYDLGHYFLLIASDRISAYDSILPTGIPDKGKVLNQISAFWFEKTRHIIPNHVVKVISSVDDLKPYLPSGVKCPNYLVGRSMVVRKAERISVEAVVRGYLSGSAWEEYRKTDKLLDHTLAAGYQESQELPEPIFTPTTKADSGHDLPITLKELENQIGVSVTRDLAAKSIEVYSYARRYAKNRGIIIADTKFEFGFIDGKLSLIDEVLTPDSSRFWDASQYKIGKAQPSFDKQIVRDWLTSSGWDKEPPAPPLPPEIVNRTSERYKLGYKMLVGEELKV